MQAIVCLNNEDILLMARREERRDVRPSRPVRFPVKRWLRGAHAERQAKMGKMTEAGLRILSKQRFSIRYNIIPSMAFYNGISYSRRAVSKVWDKKNGTDFGRNYI